jgi:hypothetical protein
MAKSKKFEVGKQEGEEVMRIATQYFLKEAGGDQARANELMTGLANLVKQDGIRLVHLGNTLFLVIVKGKGMVEVHTMSIEESVSSLAKNFTMLVSYLKGIGVKVAYTYTDDRRYEMVAKRTRLPFQKKEVEAEDGKTYTAYYLEL